MMAKGYYPLSKEKYRHEPQIVTQEDLDRVYFSRLNSVSTVKTNLYPLLTKKKMEVRSTNIQSFSFTYQKLLNWQII